MKKIIYLSENEFNKRVRIGTFTSLIVRAFDWTEMYSGIDSRYLPRNAIAISKGLFEGSYNTYDEYLKSYRWLAYNRRGFVLPVEEYEKLEESLRYTYNNIPENAVIWVRPTKYITKNFAGSMFNAVDSTVLFDLVKQNHFYVSTKMKIVGDAEKMSELDLSRKFLAQTNDKEDLTIARKVFNMINNLRDYLYTPQYEDNYFIDKIKSEMDYCKNRFDANLFFVRAYFIDGTKFDIWARNEQQVADKIKPDDYKRIVDIRVNLIFSTEFRPLSTIEFYGINELSGDAEFLFKLCYEPKRHNVEDMIEVMVRNDRRAWITDL